MNFENIDTFKLERWDYENRIHKLNGLIYQMGERYRKGGEEIPKLPIDNNCRIMMESFRKIYGENELTADFQFVEDREKEWRKGENSEEEGFKERKIGRVFELLKTALFNKFLGEKFIVVRSSRYDDYKNGVDNVMMEIKTGNVVCAFDEISDDTNFFHAEKEEKIEERNFKSGGASLKYGMSLKDGKLVPARLQNLPIFCLSLNPEKVREGLLQMEFSPVKKSPIEEKLFRALMEELTAQIQIFEEKMPQAMTEASGSKTAELEKLKERLMSFKSLILSLNSQ